ncbi:MAG: bifunctional phosphopantothenoylcysteine decarboxylase/phosphopantothenate--cysteine ligase CoaBC [Fimbriimonadaceae bacterium]|nr:bifunctional phosphopantothenoylcysteine decarboxylase/phosphopantothenate--cysteine ligase CoaBC [Fimbriimonadaceae bacterium]
MATIVLGVAGSVAAYRAADLARDFIRAGHTVRVCLTESAQQFVTPALFEALTGQPCLEDVFDEPETGRMAHIDWARQADALVIAPATARILNTLATGEGHDMLSALALAYDGPIVIAPAMNPTMLANPVTQRSIQALEERGAVMVAPTVGLVACGEEGQGKLAANRDILSTTLAILEAKSRWKGRRILITSGPTQEKIDDVRFLSNRSSGKMGAALAKAALLRGAEVTVVTGPTSVALPARAQVIRVTSANEMLAACLNEIKNVDWFIGAAAVADYRPSQPRTGKLRRSNESLQIELVPNPDIIATLAADADPNQRFIAFAAEPSDDPQVANEKRMRKRVHAIAVNDISRSDIGFETSENELTLLSSAETMTSGKRSKLACALWLFDSLDALDRDGRLVTDLA